jgi:hypothetical protein
MFRPDRPTPETVLPPSRPGVLERNDWALPVKGRWAEYFLLGIAVILGCVVIVLLSRFSLYMHPDLGPDGSRALQVSRRVGRDGFNHFTLWVDGTCYDLIWE